MISSCKKFLVITLLFTCHHLFAMPAVVISLEAPIFIKKDLNSTIIQRVRRGTVLYIHNKEFGTAPNERDFSTQNYFIEGEELLDLYENPERHNDKEKYSRYMYPEVFYKTLNKNGVEGYIQGKHIKIIYRDTRELTDNIPYPKHDVTDYRLQEPIPDEFPFLKSDRYRMLTSFGVAPSSPTNYVYNQPLNSEESSRRSNGSFSYMKNISLDKTQRLFFGGTLLWSSETKEFQLSNAIAEELKGVLSLGPIMTYDFYRKESYFLTLFGSLLLNYDRTFVKVKTSLGTEQRLFSGFYPMARAGLMCNFDRLTIPNFSLFFGTSVNLNMAYSLNADSPVIPKNWNLTVSDSVTYPFGGYLTIFVGVGFLY